jgi:hypothetical protein
VLTKVDLMENGIEKLKCKTFKFWLELISGTNVQK